MLGRLEPFCEARARCYLNARMGDGGESSDGIRGTLDISNFDAEALATLPFASAKPSVEAAPPPVAKVVPRRTSNRQVQLIWYHPALPGRARRHDAWSQLLDEVDYSQFELLAHEDPADAEDRLEINEVLCGGRPTELVLLDEILRTRASAPGPFRAPLVLVEGALRFAFDDIESLMAHMTTIEHRYGATVAHANPEIKTALADGNAFLDTVQGAVAPKLIVQMTDRLLRSAEPNLAARQELSLLVEAALLAGRRYRSREVFGDMHVCGSLTPLAQERRAAVPCYFAEELIHDLPMFVSFEARLIAELHFRTDQYESHPLALNIKALARTEAR